MPVVDYYAEKGKLKRIQADRPADDVYEDVRKLFLRGQGNPMLPMAGSSSSVLSAA